MPYKQTILYPELQSKSRIVRILGSMNILFTVMLHFFADPYVRVEVSQPSRSVSRKQTKTKKNTSTPTFNETFVFGVSPKPEDLEFTYVSITVFDYERIRSDEVIGNVRLGYGSSQSSEAEHWGSVVAKAGTEVIAVHDIVDMDDE